MQALRRCNYCKNEKSLEHFHKNKQCKNGRTGTCKTCISKKRTIWYAENRQRRQEAANKRNRERKKKVVEYFGDRCFDCKQIYPQYVYEFHHLDPSGKDVNPSKALSWSEDRMWKELNKCVMLCANCHKIRHWGESEVGDASVNRR